MLESMLGSMQTQDFAYKENNYSMNGINKSSVSFFRGV